MKNFPILLSTRLPFFYGWVVLGCASCASFARQGSAVATLSIFVDPMVQEFAWSRTAISGAVSIGGLLAAVTSPFLGPLVDRHGARVILCAAALMTGVAALGLSLTTSLIMFYGLFCIARMNFAGPFDLGIYGAVNNWFVKLRPQAISTVTMTHMIGLTAMPLIAHTAMVNDGWRSGWVAIGITVLIIGFLPSFLFMARRPEDLGLHPDGIPLSNDNENHSPAGVQIRDIEFSRSEATRTPVFWLLLAFTFMVFPVQAGVSLHQAPHLLERGLEPTAAAMVVSTFSLFSGLSAVVFGMVARRFSIHFNLVATGLFLSLGCILMIEIATIWEAIFAATLFGIGIGGILCILPIAWADYFGRSNFGSIRGMVLTIQVSAQAAGPLVSGMLRDWHGDYGISLKLFFVMSLASALIAFFSRPPRHLTP